MGLGPGRIVGSWKCAQVLTAAGTMVQLRTASLCEASVPCHKADATEKEEKPFLLYQCLSFGSPACKRGYLRVDTENRFLSIKTENRIMQKCFASLYKWHEWESQSRRAYGLWMRFSAVPHVVWGGLAHVLWNLWFRELSIWKQMTGNSLHLKHCLAWANPEDCVPETVIYSSAGTSTWIANSYVFKNEDF